jgi:hypothetical protein
MLNSSETASQFESMSLDLALVALDEIAKQRASKSKLSSRSDVEVFCNRIIAKDDDEQIDFIEGLIARGVSLDTIFEEFIPNIAERLGNLWKQNKLSFVEVNIGTQRLQRLSRIYENRYLGPLYLFPSGPAILLILPKGEIHTLGLITASGIFKKCGTNPFVAVGYTDEEILHLMATTEFKLVGMSVSHSGNIASCVQTAKKIKRFTKNKIPIVLGGQGTHNLTEATDVSVFDALTKDPKATLKLMKLDRQ